MSNRVYRFGDFEADEPRFELRRVGVRVDLQPKALDLLLYLLGHPGRVVSKDELVAHLWPNVAVTDASLSKAVSAVRRALGDRGREQRCIETVRGRGFRFVVAVDERQAPSERVADRRRHTIGLGAEAEGSFVGREDVLAAIAAAVATATGGSGRLILLAGEAGMGKTRTAREAAARALDAGARVLAGWCHEGEGAPALWPWVQLLRELVVQRDAVALTAGLGDGLADLAPLLPALRERLPELPPRQHLDPEQARFRLIDTAAELFKRSACDDPHLLILDDFHLADRASLALLRFLARELASSRLALLVTYRDDAVDAGHALLDLARQPDCLALTLTGLERNQVGRLVMLEAGTAVDAGVVAAIHKQTEGNPFFVKELTQVLLARGLLAAAASLNGATPLPSGVRAVLRQRLDRLSAECRELLAVGAAVGREFDLGTVARVAGLAPERALALLDEAHRGQVIRDVGGTERFSHALVREALLERIGAAERAALHRRIAEALEAHYQADREPHLGELAHHFCAGAASGDAERAIEYSRRAGNRAAQLLAYDEAAQHYQRALQVERTLAVADPRRTCELLLALGEAQIGSGEATEGRETLRSAADLARRLASPEHLARAALAAGGLVLSTEVGISDPGLVQSLEEALAALPEGDSALRVRLMVRLALALVWEQAYDRTATFIREAVDAARRLRDPVALSYALYAHRWSLLEPGQLEARLADGDEILRLARQVGHRELQLAGSSCRFLDLVELGRTSEADRELVDYERLAEELRVPRYRWRAGFYRAMRLLLEGRFAEGEALAQRVLADERSFTPADAGLVFGMQLATVRREQGRAAELEPALQAFADRFPGLPAWRAGLALMHAELGAAAAARDGFEAFAVDDFHGVPLHFLWLPTMVILAELSSFLGDASRARRLYGLLRPYAPRTVVIGAGVVCWGALDRYLGLLSVTFGDQPRAARHFEAALQMDTRAGARPWMGWDAYELARLMTLQGRRGDRQRARAHLAHVRQIADALGMVRLAQRAAELARTAVIFIASVASIDCAVCW